MGSCNGNNVLSLASVNYSHPSVQFTVNCQHWPLHSVPQCTMGHFPGSGSFNMAMHNGISGIRCNVKCQLLLDIALCSTVLPLSDFDESFRISLICYSFDILIQTRSGSSFCWFLLLLLHLHRLRLRLAQTLQSEKCQDVMRFSGWVRT